MDSQTKIILYGRECSGARDDVSAIGASVAVGGVGFRLISEADADGVVAQRLLETVYQALEDGAEINYRGEEARVGLFMSVKSAGVADETSDSSDGEELEKENRGRLGELLHVSQHFDLCGPR